MILVTGSTGKVGKELVRKLQEVKANFRVGARSPERLSGVQAGHRTQTHFVRPVRARPRVGLEVGDPL